MLALAVASVIQTGLVPEGTDCSQLPKVPVNVPSAKVYVNVELGLEGDEVAL